MNGNQCERVKEWIAKLEVKIETARFLENKYRGCYCFGRFSSGAQGIHGWRR
jgi:hypothetical protein